jgi:hypothetical protein
MAGLFMNINDVPRHLSTMSRLITIVDPRGFEPLTPCMPCRCATGLRHGPKLSEDNSTRLLHARLLRFREPLLERYRRAVLPEPLEGVVHTVLLVEDMRHDVPKVEQYPAALGATLAA